MVIRLILSAYPCTSSSHYSKLDQMLTACRSEVVGWEDVERGGGGDAAEVGGGAAGLVGCGGAVGSTLDGGTSLF